LENKLDIYIGWDSREPIAYDVAKKTFLDRASIPVGFTRSSLGWALFCDCDFLFLDDIAELTEYLDPSKAALCVKHDYTPKEKLGA
jgi:hypothetical protein